MKLYIFRVSATVIVLTFFAVQLFAADVSKQITRSFQIKNNTQVKIDNKFGNVIIHRWDKNTLDLRITISASAKNESVAQSTLNKIDVKIVENPATGKLEFTTITDDNKQEKSEFSINYEISMPGNVPMSIANSFGNVVMGSHTAPLDISVKFGQLIAEDLGNANIAVEFSNARCEIETLTAGAVDLKFGKMLVGDVGNVKISSQHSDLSLGNASNLILDGRHGNIEIATVKTLRGTLEFAGLKVGKLEESLIVESRHGNGLALGEVSGTFKEISLESQFSPVDIAMQSGAQAKLFFNLEFGNLKANGTGISFSKVIKEQSKSQYEGYVGKATAPGIVKVNAKYGNIRFDVN